MSNLITPELLVPAGDFDCLRAGVQNGADAIYFGAGAFNARFSANNFSDKELKEAIEYCKLRNVKTNLTLNTLVTDSEFADAFELAKSAYYYGIDAIIVQDLGLAKFLIDQLPGVEIHASTQMSVHNLEGVLELEKIGFKRVVLSRELPINEIEYIKNNSNVELEVFVHGALCISYSGQCLFSSLIGGRSGNRGKCAQPCRLPYELFEKNSQTNEISSIDKGYLLSPKDLCALEYLPKLIGIGVNSFKIEGRMKTPEYVATVTKMYRKYIDLALSIDLTVDNFSISSEDKKELLQVFNRGGFSTGHLDTEPNKDLVFPSKPNNMGLYVGNISNYNANKGYITVQLNERIAIGDSISIEGINYKYTISELMQNDKNIKTAEVKNVVKIGRMKGNIKVGSAIYKLESKRISSQANQTYSATSNIKRIPLKAFISIKAGLPITVEVYSANNPPFYNNIYLKYESNVVPDTAINNPIDKARIIEQFSKLGNTPYIMDSIDIDLDENLHIPSIGILNEVRRKVIAMLEEKIINTYSNRNTSAIVVNSELSQKAISKIAINNRKISVLLENINLTYDYTKLVNIDNIYIPLKFLTNKAYSTMLLQLSKKYNMYIYMPTIIKANYKNLLLHNLDSIVADFNIKGFVISNIAGVIFLEKYVDLSNYQIIANYTMNIFNSYTIDELKQLGITCITPSIELDNANLSNLINSSSIPVELIVYGRSVLMNSSYCLLGKTNKCYPECKMRCSNNNIYYLQDRLGFHFRIIPDHMQTVTSIYNSKITSIDSRPFNISSARINILDENIEQANLIIETVKSGRKMEGQDYTNGNLNRTI